jgi:hypothetical protein
MSELGLITKTQCNLSGEHLGGSIKWSAQRRWATAAQDGILDGILPHIFHGFPRFVTQ